MATAKKTSTTAAKTAPVVAKTASATPAPAKKAAAKTAAANTPAVKSAGAKTAATKTPAVKAPAAKTAPAKAAGPMKPISTALSKTALHAHIAAHSGVDAKHVKAVFASLQETVAAALHKKGIGHFTLPGLFKVSAVKVPAKKAREGIDPFTKQMRKFAAKPATTKVKLRGLKQMKDAAL